MLWVRDAIDQGLIQPKRAIQHSGGPDAANHWLRSHYQQIPEELRPPPANIDEFAAFFSTYLTSSFDVLIDPGTKGERAASEAECHCEICLKIINASHLKPKKLFARDKRRADFLMSECLIQLADQNAIQIDEQLALQVVTDPSTRRFAAYVAYGHWLIQRLSGDSDGPAILALWRLIAWDPRGGMRRGFTLKLDDFQLAEQKILQAIREMS